MMRRLDIHISQIKYIRTQRTQARKSSTEGDAKGHVEIVKELFGEAVRPDTYK